MTADLSSADIVILASLCWDRKTKADVATKLSKELRQGSLVIDYSSGSFESLYHEFSTEFLIKCLENALENYSVVNFSSSGACISRARGSKGFYSSISTLKFVLEGIIEGRTSWSPHQNLYIYSAM
jgi:hypothetical protein